MEEIEERKIATIAEQILRKMPLNLSKLEQARFIYIELGKMVSFDEDYWLGDAKTKKRIYSSAQRVRDFKDLSSNKVICVSLSYLYNSLLKKIGIQAEQCFEEDDPHVSSIINIDGNCYEVDLQKDLSNIQARRKSQFFGQDTSATGEEPISVEVLSEIDEKIGYSYEGEQDFLNLVESICEEANSIKNVDEKVAYILSSIGKYRDILQMGYVEKMWYYDQILRKTLSMMEKTKTQTIDMCLEGEVIKYTRCISVNKGDGIYARFIYSEKSGTFLQIEESKLIELMDQGLKTLRNKKVPGLDKKRLDTNLEDEGPNKG